MQEITKIDAFNQLEVGDIMTRWNGIKTTTPATYKVVRVQEFFGFKTVLGAYISEDGELGSIYEFTIRERRNGDKYIDDKFGGSFEYYGIEK